VSSATEGLAKKALAAILWAGHAAMDAPPELRGTAKYLPREYFIINQYVAFNSGRAFALPL
jgi:hypothetical protein